MPDSSICFVLCFISLRSSSPSCLEVEVVETLLLELGSLAGPKHTKKRAHGVRATGLLAILHTKGQLEPARASYLCIISGVNAQETDERL